MFLKLLTIILLLSLIVDYDQNVNSLFLLCIHVDALLRLWRHEGIRGLYKVPDLHVLLQAINNSENHKIVYLE